jgi:hypothetical protein
MGDADTHVRRRRLKLKLKLAAAVALPVTLMLLASCMRGSAQDVNFTCDGSTTVVLLQPEGSTNQCEWVGKSLAHPLGYTVPLAENNQLLTSYQQGGLTVTGTNFNLLNEYWGNLAPSLVPVGPPQVQFVPSIAGGEGAFGKSADATGTLTVTSSTPGRSLQFESVDVLSYTGLVQYTIQGYDGKTLEYSLSCTGSKQTNTATIADGTCPFTSSGYSAAIDYAAVTNTDPVYQKGLPGNPKSYVTSVVVTLYDPTGLDRLDNIEVQVPEGGAGLTYLLLAGIACFGAMVFRSRSKFGARAATH